MSQFDRYTNTEYIEAMRVFLHAKKGGFQRANGLVLNPEQKRKGRFGAAPKEAIATLEAQVNEKAARCEAPGVTPDNPSGTTAGERMRLARDYKGMSDAEIARAVGKTRELIRRWGIDQHKLGQTPRLAEVLDVPEAWLLEGGEACLPADSHIGVRVGAEVLAWREKLYSLELEAIANMPDDADTTYAQAYLEHAVRTDPEMAQAARRAGGRWQTMGASLLFAPWAPIPEHGLTRRYWTDEVEQMIEEELSNNSSIYGAWFSLKKRCEALGLKPDEYPKKISLHKRIDKEKERVEKFGVDLNAMVAASVAQYPQLH